MTRLAIALESALEPAGAAYALAIAVEAALGDRGAVAGAFVLSTAAAGRSGEGVGRRLASRWPGAELLGTSFEGLMLDGRVWQGEPAVAVLAWTAGPGAPVPIVCEAGQRDPDLLAKEIASAGDRVPSSPDDLVVLFPDALGPPALRPLLDRFSPAFGGPWLAGAAASGVDGGPASTWVHPADPGESDPLVGLLFPASPARVQCTGATRLASPWLEITACRTHWIDALEGEPPIVWIRRQLGLAETAPLEPHLDRLLLRLAGPAGPGSRAGQKGLPDPDPESEPEAFDELYLSGLDPRRGAVGVMASVARGDRVALALPDAGWARDALRCAVDALPLSPLVLQLGCPSRGELLHGDRDIESAVVAHQAIGRRTLGVLAPFQLGSDPTGIARLRVYSTVLAALGSSPSDQVVERSTGPAREPKNSRSSRSI